MKQEEFENKKHLKIGWMVLFVCLAIMSILVIVSSHKNFSFQAFLYFIKNSNIVYLLCAFICVLGFIFSEGWALTCICKSFGFKLKKWDGFFYSAADIYFSAITPSASGGQPASAYFMHKSGISIPVITVALLYNLLMYSISILVLSLVFFLVKPSIFLNFSLLSQCFILFGFLIQLGLILLFYCLLYKDKLLARICNFFLRCLLKVHLIKDVSSYSEKLNDVMERYQESAKLLKGKRNVLVKTLWFNILQRCCQIGVILFVFLATHGKFTDFFFIVTIYSFVIMGAYSIPVPGAMGVTDYLMIDGFRMIMTSESAIHLELLSRSVSFYACVLICGLSILFKYLYMRRSSKL